MYAYFCCLFKSFNVTAFICLLLYCKILDIKEPLKITYDSLFSLFLIKQEIDTVEYYTGCLLIKHLKYFIIIVFFRYRVSQYQQSN